MIASERLLWRMRSEREYWKGRQLGSAIRQTAEGIEKYLWKAGYDLCDHPKMDTITVRAEISKKKIVGEWWVTVE